MHPFRLAVCIIMLCGTAIAFGQALPDDRAVAELVGVYDGGEPEIAAGLELRADGRFRYGLSYGGLDEQAEGAWRLADGAVLLTSDPVIAPRFTLLGRRDMSAGRFQILLDLPKGMSRQYFDAIFSFADGPSIRRQLTDEQEAFQLDDAARPTQVVLALPMFDVRSGPVSLTGAAGQALHFRFDPNDLGKVAFARTPLKVDAGDLVLTRFDRTLRFQRQRGPHD